MAMRISQPNARVSSVSGTPTRLYSRKPIGTRACRAASTTIRFATEPRMVRLPARVDAMARMSHPRSGSPRVEMSGFKRSTAGTLGNDVREYGGYDGQHGRAMETDSPQNVDEIIHEPGPLDGAGEDEESHEEH